MQPLTERVVVLKACICILLLYTGHSYAQSSRTYSLQNIIEETEHNLPLLKQSKALSDAAEANVRDVKHEELPFFKFNAQASLGSANTVNGSYFPMGIVPSTSGSITDKQNYQATVGDLATVYSEYDVYNFGFNKAKNENAQAEANLAKAAYDKDFYELKINLSKLYFNILTYQNLQRIDEQNVKRYATIDTIILSLARAGIKPGADLSQADAELSNAKIQLNKTKTELQSSLQTLSTYTGIPVEVLSINNRLLDSSTVFNALQYDSSEENNPVLNYYKSNTGQLEASEQVIKKSYLPKFTLIGSLWGRASSYAGNNQFNALSDGLGFQ